MRAWVVEKPAPIAERPMRLVADRPVPEPGPGQLLIRVQVCGVCRTDLHLAEGDLEPRRPGVTPGHQVVGRVETVGPGAEGWDVGQRVGVAWLHETCGHCAACARGEENLCDAAQFTGWDVDGGFAEYCTVPAAFCHPLPDGVSDLQAAPLLCAGIIGYRSLCRTGCYGPGVAVPGTRLGLYGFGAAGHVVIQLARARGLEVYVCTRDRARHQALARELGAAWVGDAKEAPPVPLDCSIIFAPAGDLVPPALEALRRGGRLVLGGIHMTPIPELDYGILWGERSITTVANNTRADARQFLAEAERIGLQPEVQEFALEDADQALLALAHDAIRGAAVLRVAPDHA